MQDITARPFQTLTYISGLELSNNIVDIPSQGSSSELLLASRRHRYKSTTHMNPMLVGTVYDDTCCNTCQSISTSLHPSVLLQLVHYASSYCMLSPPQNASCHLVHIYSLFHDQG